MNLRLILERGAIASSLKATKKGENRWKRRRRMINARIIGGGVVDSHLEWGASCLLLNIDGFNLVVDCGIRVATRDRTRMLPLLEKISTTKIDAIVFTHAHSDHICAGPVIASQHPEARILMTDQTVQIGKIGVHDARRISEKEDTTTPPIFSEQEEENFWKRAELITAKEWRLVGKDIEICLWPAGHLIGAAMVLIKTRQGVVIVTGDFALHNLPTIPAAEALPAECDRPLLLITEGTYGRSSPPRLKEEERFIQAVIQTVQRGGNVLVPRFAIGNAQDAAVLLANNGFKTWIGGMARRVFNSSAYDQWHGHKRITQFANVEYLVEEVQEPRVVVATDGMLQRGNSMRLAYEWIDVPGNLIAFTGYLAPGTFGSTILDAAQNRPGKWLEFPIHPEEKTPMKRMRARIEKFSLSSHVDGFSFINWIRKLDPKNTIFVHSQKDSYLALREELRRKENRFRGAIFKGANETSFTF